MHSHNGILAANWSESDRDIANKRIGEPLSLSSAQGKGDSPGSRRRHDACRYPMKQKLRAKAEAKRIGAESERREPRIRSDKPEAWRYGMDRQA